MGYSHPSSYEIAPLPVRKEPEKSQMRARLTDKFVQSLKGDDAYRTYWDLQLPAFGVRCGKHRKTFVIMTGTQRKRTTIGHYPHVSLQEARIKARHLLLSPPSSSPLFEDALRDYCNLHLRPNTRATTAKQAEQILRKHFAHFYTVPIADLKRSQIIATIDGLLDRPAGANQALSVFGAFLQWRLRRTLIQHNPIAGYGLPIKLKPRERVLSDHELQTIMRFTFQSSEQYHRLVALLVLTGQRRNEIGRSEWTWLKDETLTIPAHVAKNGRQHTIPLTKTAVAIIGTIPRGSRYWSTPNEVVRLEVWLCHRGGLQWRRSTSLKRSSRSCGRLMF
jgi:integrase